MISRRARTAAATAGAGIIYLTLACLVYAPVQPWDRGHLVTCVCGDSVQEPWFLHWTPFALSRGHNPMFTNYLNVPHGANLAVNTSMPLLGVLGWPVTSVANSVATYNLLLRLALGLSALSMYLVLRRYVEWRPAAFVGGLWFGFSPYMIGQGRQHLFLVFLPLVPLFVPLLDDWLIRPRRPPARSGIYVGLLAGAQLLISAEVLLLVVLFAAIALATLAARYRSLARARLALLLPGVAVAAVVAAAVGSLLLWMYLFGPQRPAGPPHAVSNLDTYHADLLSPLLPSRAQLLAPHVARTIADRFVRGSLEENGLYLGFPVIVALLVALVWLRKHSLVLAMTSISATSFVFSLGLTLTVANHSTHIPMPAWLLAHVPVLQEIEPARLSMALQLAVAVSLALLLSRLYRSLLARPRWLSIVAAGAVGALALLVAAPRLPLTSTRIETPPYFSSAAVRALPSRTIALTFPFEYLSSNDAMMWQIEANMHFRLFGGEAYVPGPRRIAKDWPLTELPVKLRYVFLLNAHWRNYAATNDAVDLGAALRSFLQDEHVGAVFVATTSPQGRWVSSVVAQAVRRPGEQTPGLDVWTAPPGLLSSAAPSLGRPR